MIVIEQTEQLLLASATCRDYLATTQDRSATQALSRERSRSSESHVRTIAVEYE